MRRRRTVHPGRLPQRRIIRTGLLVVMMMAIGSGLAAGIAGGAMAASSPRHADEVNADAVVEKLPDTSWFDKDSGEYRPPKIEPVRDDPVRLHGRPAKTRRQSSTQRVTSGAPPFPGFSSEFISAAVITLLGIMLVTLLGLFVYYSLHDVSAARSARMQAGSVEIDPARVVDLPFEATAQQYVDPLAEAARLVDAGRFDQAIIYVYGYMLLALDKHGWIELQKGKTNRMYLKELSSTAQMQRIVEQVVIAFEEVFFGNHSLSAEQFQAIWDSLPAFHALLESHRLAAGEPQGRREQEASQ